MVPPLRPMLSLGAGPPIPESMSKPKDLERQAIHSAA
jgi:hypothetical protein